MGERAKKSRRASLTLRCAWCGWIKVGTGWAMDRRRPSDARCSHGLCPKCRANYFLENMDAPGR
jgi:hypothetical protein